MSIPRAGSSDAGDDSASESDDGAADYYEPISTVDNGGEDCLAFNHDGGDDNHHSISHRHVDDLDGASFESHNFFGNGVSLIDSVRNGISTIDLVHDNHNGGHGDDDEEEEEEERLRQDSETAMLAAFREDESRRSAPLPPERTSAIVNAMRNVSFSGFHPSWADHIPEDQWIDRLRQLPQQPANQN